MNDKNFYVVFAEFRFWVCFGFCASNFEFIIVRTKCYLSSILSSGNISFKSLVICVTFSFLL